MNATSRDKLKNSPKKKLLPDGSLTDLSFLIISSGVLFEAAYPYHNILQLSSILYDSKSEMVNLSEITRLSRWHEDLQVIKRRSYQLGLNENKL